MRGPRAAFRAWERRWKDGWADDISRPGARRNAWLDMLVFDHGLLRLTWRNLHEIAPGVWRGNQPGPGEIRALKARGFRAVLNLRGETRYGSYLLEREACEAAGLRLVDFKMHSRQLPEVEKLHQLDQVFRAIERPFLIHCKSGADRAGFASALYLLFEGVEPAVAKRQLSLRYLHVRSAATGVLDYMIEAYEADHAARSIAFRDWIDSRYDPVALASGFRSGAAANFLVDQVLGRE